VEIKVGLYNADLGEKLHCFGKERVLTNYQRKRHVDRRYWLKSLRVDVT